MKQKATVVSTDGNSAIIKVDRMSMCDGCHKSGCSDSCALYKIFGAKTEIEASCVNKAGAAVGDTVVVEASDSRINLSAFFVFLLPVLVAAAVYFALFFVSDETLRIAASVLSFVVYFAVLAIVEKFKKNDRPRLVITDIVDRSAK